MNEQGTKNYLASGREADRKNRTRRLIQLGALAEKYLHCEGVSPEGFEEKVKQLIAAEGRERAAGSKTVNDFLRDLTNFAGTGNGIGASTVERLKVLAAKLGYLPNTPAGRKAVQDGQK